MQFEELENKVKPVVNLTIYDVLTDLSTINFIENNFSEFLDINDCLIASIPYDIFIE